MAPARGAATPGHYQQLLDDMEAAKQEDAPHTATAPMSIDAAEPQSFWMDQQGNIYYAAGFPGVEKGKAPSSPIPIKPPSAADQHQEPVRNRAA